MNKKRIFLLLAFIMLVTVPIMAQAPFDWGEIRYEIIGSAGDASTTTVDTTTADTVANVLSVPTIPVYEKTWEMLEKQLRTACKHATKGQESSKNVKFAYRIQNIPTKNGDRTMFLCNLKQGGFFLSCDNPNEQETLYSCYTSGIWQCDGILAEKKDYIIPNTTSIQTRQKGNW